jgi:hypothetical protein
VTFSTKIVENILYRCGHQTALAAFSHQFQRFALYQGMVTKLPVYGRSSESGYTFFRVPAFPRTWTMTPLLAMTLVRSDQIRSFLIRLARPKGWEAAGYDDLRIIQQPDSSSRHCRV